MRHFADLMCIGILIIGSTLIKVTPGKEQRPKSKQGFDVCAERVGIVQKAKGAQVAATMVDKCFLPIISKYKFTPKMFQKGIFKMCVVFRFCYHKYITLKASNNTDINRDKTYDCIAKMASLLTVDLNPEWIEKTDLVNPKGLYFEGAECARKHKIFPEDPATLMFTLKWVRDTLF
ncbi:uncharacterized protein LOC119441586 [Dermacentor silvarum]|uniref:uncharacterized protein LOC119441586 n=1 Tax=Dermacentor silvarum TaxID=543639 RepID=UPI0021007AE7|nr:uncharacterized protein LOC119441586 [Dermacentor silvarum]